MAKKWGGGAWWEDLERDKRPLKRLRKNRIFAPVLDKMMTKAGL